MVRDKTTILAEVNDEDTVLVKEESPMILENGFVIGADGKTILQKTIDYGAIIYLYNGQIQELKIQPNKRLGLDADGNLVWL